VAVTGKEDLISVGEMPSTDQTATSWEDDGLKNKVTIY
jgi:hypothetical protein